MTAVNIGTEEIDGNIILDVGLVAHGFPKLAVEIPPLVEAVLATVESGRDVQSLHGRLDKERAAAAHRIDEIAVALPAAFQDHGRGGDLVQRRRVVADLVAPLVQLLAGTV